MANDGTITNRMLLEHIQAGDNSIREELKILKKGLIHLEEKVDRGFADVDRRFEEARLHREAIQEDLDATIKMQSAHEQELAVLTGRPLPENY